MIDPASPQTFFAPPTFRVALAGRESLLGLVRTSANCRVVLLDAPAGYGKTWLLGQRYAELRASGAPVVWLGIEEADAAQLLTMLAESLSRAGIGTASLETMAAQGFADVPLPAAVRALAAALGTNDVQVTVFVDDIHRLEKSAARDVLARLITEAPTSTRFLLSGRDSSGLPHAALRARGDLRELGVNELRFAHEEAHALLPRLDNSQLGRLLAKTEGWPVALQLARLWLDSKPERSTLLDAFSGRTSEVAEYLTEQVLGDLPDELLSILSDISILDGLNPDLVAAITDSQQTWSRLLADRRLEHFLVPLDEERFWFRIHHLLRDYLRARRRDSGLDGRELHARATLWFEHNGRVREAVRHAVLADDIPRAAGLIERTGGWELTLFGGASLMRALLESLPWERMREFPRLQVYRAFLLAKDGDVAYGIRVYEEVRDAPGRRHTGPLERDLLIVGLLISIYADRAVGPDDLQTLYRNYESLPANDNVARATLLNTACLLAFRIGAMSEALDLCRRAVQEMRRIGSVLGTNYCLFHLGLALLHVGERREAEATFREAVAQAEENFGADSGLKAIADVYLALALHACGDVGGAYERIATALGQVEAADGWLDLYAEAYEVAIANAIAREDRPAAAAMTSRMTQTALRRGLVRLERLAAAFKSQTAQLSGLRIDTGDQPANGRIELGCAPPGLEWNAGAWRLTPAVWREHHALGLVQILAAMSGDRPAEAMPIIDDLAEAARIGDRRRQLRVLGALRAAVTLKMGDADAAVAAFTPVLEAAVSEDDTQFLIDFGPALLPLLQRAWASSRSKGVSSRVRHVIGNSVTTLGRAVTAHGDSGSLSARELEVLVELASGAPNKVIARNLQMTENTVKFHLKRVFQKLHVRHRAEALQAARTRGLLS
jgi:LuxR family transcriptional regulator, maltose regulon positive regulatory protein